jgi:hypothetical protein
MVPFSLSSKLAGPADLSSAAGLLSRIAQSAYNAQTLMNGNLSPAHPDDPLAIGIDIGGTAIKAGIVGIRGDLRESFRAPSPRTSSALRDFAHSALKRARVPVRGVGIGCKGIIDADSSRVKSLPGDLHFLEGQLLSEVIDAGDQNVFIPLEVTGETLVSRRKAGRL